MHPLRGRKKEGLISYSCSLFLCNNIFWVIINKLQGRNFRAEKRNGWTKERKMKADAKLDCFGLLCPLPIIKTEKKLKEMKAGEVLEVIATDEGIKEDMPAWCRLTGQEYFGWEKEGEVYKVYVRKVKD